jgi:lipopolysaccharide/colanic/teichoic acid biosynthesis glycosyltransferase
MWNTYTIYSLWRLLLNALFCIVAFFLFIPLTTLLFLINPFFNKGPIFYTQIRLGKNAKKFKLYKYRTMVVGAEKGSAIWAIENDVRVTYLGKFLRKFRIDELPQFLNIILFQINLIGPRAERPELHELILKEVPNFSERLKIKPGVTGHAQVMGGYSNDFEGARQKLEFDLGYINEQSILFDIKILYRTCREVVNGAGL